MSFKSISQGLFMIGIAHMASDGWLVSWWFVPDYRVAGPAFFTETSFYKSQTFFTFWALSAPLGFVFLAISQILDYKLNK